MRTFITLCSLLLLANPASAAALDDIRFIKISAAEQAAVIKTPSGQLELLRPGERIGSDLHIVAIEDHLAILEGPGDWAPIKYFVDMSSGEMRISRLARRPLEKHHFERGEVKSKKQPQ